MFQKNPQMETVHAEVRLFLSRVGSLRSIFLHLALLAAFGFWIPRLKGLDFFDPEVLGAYACLGLLFAGPAAAQSFTDGVPSSFQQAGARIFVGVLYGEGVVVALLGSSFATIYGTYRGRFVPTPDWESLAKVALCGLAASIMLASLAALVAVRFSRRWAMLSLRLVFFGLLILFFYYGQSLPDLGFTATAACLAVSAVEIELLRRA